MLPSEITYKDLQVRLQVLGCCLADKTALYNEALELGKNCEDKLEKLAYANSLFKTMMEYNTSLVLIPEITVDSVVIQEEVVYESQADNNCISIEQADIIFQYLQDYCHDCFREYGYYDTGILPSNDSGGWVGSSGIYVVSRQVQSNWTQTDIDAVDYIKNKSINGYIEEGNNITITGQGTLDDPYVITSSGGGGPADTGDIRFQGSWIKNVDTGSIYMSPQDGTTWLNLPSDTQAAAGSYVQLASVDTNSGGIYLTTNNGTSYNNWEFKSDATVVFPNNALNAGTNNIDIKSSDWAGLWFHGIDTVWQADINSSQDNYIWTDSNGSYIQSYRGADGNSGPEWNNQWNFRNDGILEAPGRISFGNINFQSIGKGNVSAHAGYYGISLYCSVGYELNWQEGYLAARQPNSPYDLRPIYIDSLMEYSSDLSGDYTNRSLVDKEYVDNLIPSVGTWAGLNYPTWTSGTPFVKMDAAGSFILDNNTYLTSAVTSVGLTMPAAFTVTNTPITSSGDIDVRGAGTSSQYIRGDGSLATFPTTSGGGSSVSYYLNGSTNPSPTITGYRQMSKTPINGAGTNFTLTNTTGFELIAAFATNANDPSLLSIPAGAWDINFYFGVNNNNGAPKFYVELLKYDTATTTFTSIASNSATPESITNGTTIDLYTTSISVPLTTLTITDRLVIKVYVDTSGNRTVTFYTEDNHLAQIITTFSAGLTSLNGLTAQVQTFATPGTTGTTPNWSSATSIHTLNIPLANATGVTAGLISKAQYDVFNGKQDALNGTGFIKASGTSISYDNSTYITGNQSITLTGDVTGSGATSISTAIGNNKVTNAMLAQIATATFKGRTTASTGNVEDLTATQATALLDTFTSSLKGLTPSSGGGTTNFLRADGTWAAPSSGNVNTIRVSGANVTTTSTSGSTITGLTITPTANKSYEFWGFLIFSNTTVGGTKFGIVTTSNSIQLNVIGASTGGTFATAYTTSQSLTGQSFGNATTYSTYVFGKIVVGANTNAINFQFGVGVGGTSTIFDGSWIKYQEI